MPGGVNGVSGVSGVAGPGLVGGPGGANPEPHQPPVVWDGGRDPIDQQQSGVGGPNYGPMSQEESKSVSLSRKYGYAIMALSVVVLAVLMVRRGSRKFMIQVSF